MSLAPKGKEGEERGKMDGCSEREREREREREDLLEQPGKKSFFLSIFFLRRLAANQEFFQDFLGE